MKQIDYNIRMSDDVKKAKEEKIAELSENSRLLDLMKRSRIPMEYLQKDPWDLERWLQYLEPCRGCRGLENCTQDMKGYCYFLKYDPALTQFVLRPCRFEIEKEKAEAHLQNYVSCDLTKSQKTLDFRNINQKEESASYASVLLEVITACRENRGIYLYGPMGSGKSYLAACAANEMARQGHRTAYIHYPAFCQRMASGVVNGEFKREFERVKNAYFLVIDDIGAEGVTEWNRDQILLSLLDYRYNEGLTTWFTSNYDIASLEDHFRIAKGKREEAVKASRIAERVRVLAKSALLESKDRRNYL